MKLMNREKLLKEKENILKNIEKRKDRIAQIERELKELDNKKWKPECNENYYYISSDGNVYEEYNCNWSNDCDSFSIGNYFKTRKEAEFAVERLKVLEELKEFSYEFSVEEWDNPLTRKYYIFRYEINKAITIEYTTVYRIDLIYFKTKEDAQKAIDKIGEERLKKYYFRVENNG